MREWLGRVGVAASSSKLGGIFYAVVCRRIDSVLIPLSKGRFSMGPPGQTVLVTTTGARTGRPRKTSLAFLWDGEDMIVVASKGGSPRHPAWYHNMKADPRVVVQWSGGIEARRALEAEGADRDALFSRMAETFANFAAYQKRAANRTIPVMRLAPRGEA
ncbi:MAG: nitroreductase/quinone reductase family protein [Myxococcota bacterium]